MLIFLNSSSISIVEKQMRLKLSGKMILSTDEFEISLSCQRDIFSSALTT